MKSYKYFLEKTTSLDGASMTFFGSLGLEESVAKELAKRLLAIVMKNSNEFTSYLRVEDGNLFLFGKENPALMKDFPSGELFIVRLEPFTKKSKWQRWRYFEDVVSLFFGEKLEWHQSRDRVREYSLDILYSSRVSSWSLQEVLAFLIFVKIHLKSNSIQEFFEEIDNIALITANKKQGNKIKTENKRALEFGINIQRYIAEEILISFLLKDRPVRFPFQSKDECESLAIFREDRSPLRYFAFDFDQNSEENYLVSLVRFAPIDLDRSGSRLANLAMKLVGVDYFKSLRSVENCEFRRFYFLHSSESDLVLGALDTDKNVRLACELKLKLLNREAS